jgi:hypothetical protein
MLTRRTRETGKHRTAKTATGAIAGWWVLLLAWSRLDGKSAAMARVADLPDEKPDEGLLDNESHRVGGSA